MRPLRLLLALIVVGGGARAGAETVDVSKQWNEHVSASTPTPASLSAPVKPSTATEPSSEGSAAIPAACECELLTVQERLERATYAFTGRVEQAQAPKKGKRKILFDVDQIFKGSPKQDMEIIAEVSGTVCDLPFEEGQTYLVYGQWEWGHVVTSICMGTKVIEKAKSDRAALGPDEALKDKLYEHLRDACMGRIDTPCCLSSLKVLREGYYVPEPELGCPSGTIPDRLRCAGSYTWCIPLTEKTHHQAEH